MRRSHSEGARGRGARWDRARTMGRPLRTRRGADGMSGADPDLLAEAVRKVGRFLVADVPVGETLRRIAELAKTAVPSAAVSLTLLDRDARASTAVSTDPLAVLIDEAQYQDGRGPCLTALEEARVVPVGDIAATHSRWPTYARTALAAGMRSSLSVPLATDRGAVGAINLYATEAAAFDPRSEAAAQDFAVPAAAVIANSLSYWQVFDLAEGLKVALDSRDVIGLAKGLLMATSGCTPDEAFQMLVRASQRENLKLRDVAARIVESRRPVR